MKTHLRVEFQLTGAQRCVYVDRLELVTGGFWVNESYERTQGSDARYWVPPSKIIHVTKEDVALPKGKKR